MKIEKHVTFTVEMDALELNTLLSNILCLTAGDDINPEFAAIVRKDAIRRVTELQEAGVYENAPSRV